MATAALLVLVGFAPPVAYVVWVRNLEAREREPWREIAKMFAWGALGAIALALVASAIFAAAFEPAYAALGIAIPFASLTAVLVAPLAEEPAKALGLRWVRNALPEPEDGLVYGAAAGLGFAATENLFYAIDALDGGLANVLVVGSIRAVASALLHASTTAVVGYAFLQSYGVARKLAYLLLAIAVHGAYNALLSAGSILEPVLADPSGLAFFGFFAAIALSLAVFARIRRHLRRLDEAA